MDTLNDCNHYKIAMTIPYLKGEFGVEDKLSKTNIVGRVHNLAKPELSSCADNITQFN